MNTNPSLFKRLLNTSLVLQIVFGIIAGVIIASISPSTAISLSFLGGLFVGALKAVAPILVFVLVASSIANQKRGTRANLKPIINLYLLGTLLAASTAVMVSYFFPTTLALDITGVQANPPEGIVEVLNTLLFKIVDNPVNALVTGNFIGILAWAAGLGVALKQASQGTKSVLQDISNAVTKIVHLDA